VVIDISSCWICDYLHPLDDGSYWELFFKFESLKMLIVSIFIGGELRNKGVFAEWIVLSFIGFCVADFIDVLMGNRSEVTFLDWLSVVSCLINLLFTVKNYTTSKRKALD
jgi:hypothetical protein